MANLLVDWLNSYGLSTEVKDLSAAISNGYVLAELFSLENHLSSSSQRFPLLCDLGLYSKSRTLHSSMKNFSMLQSYLQNQCKVTIEDSLISAVIQQKRGAATKLVFMIKQFLQPELVKKKLPNEQEEVVESPREDDVLRVSEPCRDMQLAIQNKLDKQKLDSVLHLARYDQLRIEVEAKCEVQERKERRELAALQKKRHSLDREEKRRREEAREAQELEDVKAWKKNVEVTRTRLKRELMFELGAREKRALKRERVRRIHEVSAQTGIHAFSMNLKRLGIEEDDPISQTPISDLDPKERLQAARKRDSQSARAYMKEIKAKKLAALASEKERAQRKIKVAVDQARSQTALNATKAQAQLLSRIQQEGRKERELADQRRLARHRKLSLKLRKGGLISAARASRSNMYLEDVRVELSEREGERRERRLMKAEECPLARRLRETEEAKAEAVLVCSPALDKLIESVTASSSEDELLDVFRCVNEEYLQGQGAWHCGDANDTITNDPVRDMFKAIEDLALQKPGPPKHNFGLRVCVVGGPKSGKSSIAAMIKHRFNATVVPFSSLVTQVCANYVEASNEIDSELLNSLDEDVAKKILKDIGDETKGDEQLAMTSVHISKLIALRIASLSDETSWVVDGFPNTLQQAQMFDFICSDTVNISAPTKQFEAYCKERGDQFSSETVHCTMHCSFQEETNAVDIPKAEQEENSDQPLRRWASRYIVLGTKQHLEQQEQAAAPGAAVNELRLLSDGFSREQFVNNGEQALIAAMGLDMQSSTALKSCSPGVALLRRHIEACDPFGTGERIDLTMAQVIYDKWNVQEKVFHAKLRQVFHRLHRLEARRMSMLEEVRANGMALIHERDIPAGFERPAEQRKRLIDDFQRQDDRRPCVQAVLETSLWRTAFQYSQGVDRHFSQLEAELLNDQDMQLKLEEIIQQLLSIEEENFHTLRGLLQAVLRHFPFPFQRPADQRFTIMNGSPRSTFAVTQDRILSPSTSELLIVSQTKLQLYQWRDLRNGSTQHQGAPFLAALAKSVMTRIHSIARYAKRWKASHEMGVTATFDTLRGENTTRLESLDNHIRSIVREVALQAK